MIPLPPDPTAAALQALTCGETPELRAAAPMLLHKALARWPAHPELIDALVTLCEELPETALLEARALVPLLDAQAKRVDDRGADLSAAAARLLGFTDAAEAFNKLIVALGIDPRHAAARRQLSALLSDPSIALEDGMETLAFGAFRGEIDAQAVIAVFDLCQGRSPLSRQRSLLARI